MHTDEKKVIRLPITTRLLIVLLGLTLVSMLALFIVSIQIVSSVGEIAQESSIKLGSVAVEDSATALTSLGENAIEQKAIDIAYQVQIYLESHPVMTSDEQAVLSQIAVQPVGKTGYTIMIDRDKAEMVYHVNPEMIGFDLSQWADKLPAFWEIFEAALSGNPSKGYYDWVDQDGRTRSKYMYIAPVHNTQYMLAATTYIDEFSYPATETSEKINAVTMETTGTIANKESILRTVFITVTIFLMCFAGFVAWYLARRFSRPILALVEGAQQLSEGKLNYRVEINTGDEIEKLAKQFNTMAAALQDSYNVLEQRVEERTVAEKRRSEQLRAINEVGQHITSLMNLNDLLPFVVQSFQKTFGYYRVSISLLDPESGELIPSAFAGPAETSGRVNLKGMGEGIAKIVMETAQPLVLNKTTRFPGLPTSEDIADKKSEMAVPICLSNNMMGVLDIKSEKEDTFNDLDIFTASTLADFVAIAIENARLYQNVRDIATLEERNRLAREIHDTLAQGFVGVVRQLEVAERMINVDTAALIKHLNQAKMLARSSLNEARRSVLSLKPSVIEHISLPDAIQKEATRFSEINTIPVQVNINGQPAELTANVEESILRIFKEAVANIGKHADATNVDVFLSYDRRSIKLKVQDNGAGFNIRTKKRGTFGIIDMKERVSNLNGKMKIESSPGNGTTVTVSIPT
jgi:signal transduction histidine kinase